MPRVINHIDDNIIYYDEGYLACVFEIGGLAFDTIDDNELVRKYLSLKDLFVGLAKNFPSDGAIWFTLKREKIIFDKIYKTNNKFCNQFISKYMENFQNGKFFKNTYYVTLLIKEKDLIIGKKKIKEQIKIMLNYLVEYNPRILGTYKNKEGVIFSEIYEFFGSLINGIKIRIPISNQAGYKIIPNATIYFGTNIAEIRNEVDGHQKFAVMYDLKDFGVSKMLVLNNILSLPFEFTFSQSFLFIPSYEVLDRINKQLNNLESVGDKAYFQAEELIHAQGQTQAGTLTFGDYSGVIVVYGDKPQDCIDYGASIYGTFLSSGGYMLKKAGLSAPASFFAQIPGSKEKPRTYPKAISNVLMATGFYNYAYGKEYGNPLGDGSALMPLLTESNTVYFLNYHYTNSEEVNIGEAIAGHTLILGTTEAGKTTLNCAIVSFLHRFNINIFVLDLTQGMEIFIRALGGKYFTLKEGIPTGMNPFLLEDTKQNRSFLYDFVQNCIGRKITAEEAQDLKEAVDMLYQQPISQRNFNHLQVNSIDLQTEISIWKSGGQFDWVFSGDDINKYNPNEFNIVAFDVTDILKESGERYRPTLPVLSYIFHLRKLMLQRVAKEGSYMMTIVEEFWKATSFERIREVVKDILKNDRKLKSWIVLVSQSPEDAIDSPIFASIAQQTSTKILLPNPDAMYENSYDKLKITHKEFEYLSKLTKKSRKFLVKQDNQATVAKLDLYGMDEEIAVLSGSKDNVELLYEVMAKHGEDVEDWYNPFMEAIEHKKQLKKGKIRV